MSFLVVYLTESLGYSLVAAGLVLTVANVGGIVGRIAWGGIRRLAPRAARAAGLARPRVRRLRVRDRGLRRELAAGGDPRDERAVRRDGDRLERRACSPRSRASRRRIASAPITGASGFLTFGGVMLGPPVFALIAALTGGYRSGFATFGSLAVGCGLWLLLRRTK